MIDRKLLLAFAPKTMGDQVHINHTGCSSGVDKKKRLYIKRTPKGIVAYCHHCAEAGFASDGISGDRMATWLTEKTAPIVKSTTVPMTGPLSVQAETWLLSHYCSTGYFGFSGVRAKHNQIALTLRNPETDVIGYQVRNLLPGATPKYITSYIYSGNKGDSAWFHYGLNKTLVITEDYLSAYRVSQDTHGSVSSLALLRTTITDRTLLQIYELGFKNVVIWLDPDEAGIKGATKAQKELTHFLSTETSIKVINIGKEPKECTVEELSTILKGL
ncbi:Archaeal primase DnaG/twinkle, TOPRIM domain [uncultured Caudovirales phage]|uniref:Archaeal primase DnaG/twinkle, TOPRIM domain n=1 Tax=uncultured Caudovirales phage TaxID=2100421 RepID=A0A6J5TA10_9CAUD|nr:Archaeal primase DnaG/twinkle, TOPRIM domain [uncultured Caudovirales phage]